MKLLIDGWSKQARSICNNIRFCKDLQILVYDPHKINIHGMDLVVLTNVFTPEMEYNGCKPTLPCDMKYDFKYINDRVEYIGDVYTYNNSWAKSTLDINKALEWCDVYACMDSVEYDLITTNKYDETCQEYLDKFERMHWVKEHNKTLYLSHRLDKLFAKESLDYSNMLNTKLDSSALEHMRVLSNGVLNAQSENTDVKLVVGTYSASGKFSLALKCKEWYDTHNERTGIIFTENTADLINSYNIEHGTLDDSLIINASREWSDLNLDDYIEYIQHAVAYLEQRGCKHILLQGQGSYGLHNMNKYYINENTKLMNVNNSILEHAIGCKSVAIATCVNIQEHTIALYDYFHRICNLPVTDMFFSVYNHAKEYEPYKLEICDGKSYININDVCNNGELCMVINQWYTTDSKINFYTSDFLSNALLDKLPVGNIDYLNFEFDIYIETVFEKMQNILDTYSKINGGLEEFEKRLNMLRDNLRIECDNSNGDKIE